LREKYYSFAETVRLIRQANRAYDCEGQLEKIEPLPPITVASSSSGRLCRRWAVKVTRRPWLSSVSFPPTTAVEKYNSMRGPSCGRSGEESGPQQHIASRLGEESVRVAGPRSCSGIAFIPFPSQPVHLNLLVRFINYGTIFFLSQQISFSRFISRRNHQPNRCRVVRLISQADKLGGQVRHPQYGLDSFSFNENGLDLPLLLKALI